MKSVQVLIYRSSSFSAEKSAGFLKTSGLTFIWWKLLIRFTSDKSEWKRIRQRSLTNRQRRFVRIDISTNTIKLPKNEKNEIPRNNEQRKSMRLYQTSSDRTLAKISKISKSGISYFDLCMARIFRKFYILDIFENYYY